MKSVEIRQKFLDFFKEKEHLIVPSSPMVNKEDPTLMFINAGMNQFKDYFLGNETPPKPRIADTQKCLRVSGKHNDLEEVGRDSYHQTMFEMLGNWSFGDYFKNEAISWAWELLVDVYGLSPERLYATVFSGDEKDKLAADEESAEIWFDFLPKDRVLYFDRKDNFWEMGETGPCGPCTEIHIDLRSDDDRDRISGADLVNMDHPEVIEIWNLVFIQFNRTADGNLHDLPNKHVDTGMGFERLCMALQGKNTNYDTDIFRPIIAYIESETDIAYQGRYTEEAKTDIAMRVIADHSRAVSFAIADGAIPSNTGAGYVIRRILRRAIRYYYSYLNINEPFIYKLIAKWADYFDGVFPELIAQKDFIEKIIKEEEKSFLRTIDSGLKKMSELNISNGVIDGEAAFELYDTYGFPIDLTRLIAEEKKLKVDDEGFHKALEAQRSRARADAKKQVGDWTELENAGSTIFVGYDKLSIDDIRILKYRTVIVKEKPEYHLVLDRTPFYPEGGGQVGDKGTIDFKEETIRILNTVRENNLIIHVADKIPANGQSLGSAKVNNDRRSKIEANHTATHLLHAALRDILGVHVEQRGSLVNDRYLRFDFSHYGKVTDQEIEQIETIVNAKIRSNIAKIENRDLPIDQAKESGAMMLFGEKYGETVRMITFDTDYSVELCGGCHVQRTGDIGLFKISQESAVAAGIRRIEAITAQVAESYVMGIESEMKLIKQLLKSPKNAESHIRSLLDENKLLKKELGKIKNEAAGSLKDDLIASAVTLDGVKVIAAVVDVPDPQVLKNLTFDVLKDIGDGVVLLGMASGVKAQLMLAIDKEVMARKNIHAGKLIKPIAGLIKGGGGGQPFFASAGGTDPSQLGNAIELGRKNIEEALI